jgi:uncharacterized protein
MIMDFRQGMGTAVITGASSGIGAIYADRMAARGYDVVLVARNERRLGEVANRVGMAHGRSVTAVIADLNNQADLHLLEARIRTEKSITMLVNCAGFGAVSSLVDSDVDHMEDMILLNIRALTRLTHAVAPAFVARGTGTIINIASILAIQPAILNSVYGATKAYVLAFTQALHHELSARGVRIHIVLPGPTVTDFWRVAGMAHTSLPDDWMMTAEDVVDASLDGLDRGEIVTLPSLQDPADWCSFDADRHIFFQKLLHSTPAPRYRSSRSSTGAARAITDA